MACSNFLPSDVDAVILNYRVGRLAAQAARSIHNEGVKSIFVVDNKSDDDSISVLRSEASDISEIIPLTENAGFSSGNNSGASYGKKPLILFMNPDVTLKPGALQEMLKILNINPEIGVIGPSLFWPDGKPQASAYFFLSPNRIFNSLLGLDRLGVTLKWQVLVGNADIVHNGDYTGPVESLYGACMLVRRDAFTSVDGFDEDFFLYCEETDLCLRLVLKGWKIYRAGKAEAIHWHGQSANQISKKALILMSESHRLYAHKHFSLLGRIITALAFVLGLCLRVIFASTFQAKSNYFAALGVWLGWTSPADTRKKSGQSNERLTFLAQSRRKILVEQDTMRLAILFHRVGPYHFTRLRAAGNVMQTTLIEIFKGDEVYDWDPVPGADGFNRLTLFEKNPQPAHKLAKSIQAALDESQPNAVAIPGWADAVAFSAIKWCITNRVPAIVMSETTEWDEPRLFWKEWIKRRVLKMCAAGFVGGQPHAEYLTRLGTPAGQIFQGYDAVDNEHFGQKAQEARDQQSKTREKYGLPEKYILASARFVEKKNLSRLIRAYAQYRELAEKSPNHKSEVWDLVLLGDGPLKTDLLRLIADLGLQKSVFLPGFKQYDDLPAYYGLAKFFIHASTTEQWGLVVNEAMASGLPVLVSNRCGCARDLVREGINGFTFNPYNVDQIANLMLRLSANSSADFNLTAMGLASRKIISSWGPDRFAKGLAQAVETALAKPLPKSTAFDRLLLELLLKT